ncbi:DUF2946 domain-containing protein [Paraburkholderia sp. BR10879]|uniref:DUF2946 domain-containing protein n=1 Tax=Paraburkholderia sp. BR10879 TaxID=3236990 RepID=UPI00397DC170
MLGRLRPERHRPRTGRRGLAQLPGIASHSRPARLIASRHFRAGFTRARSRPRRLDGRRCRKPRGGDGGSRGIIAALFPPLHAVRRFHLRLGSLLGTLALLMATLAPVVSHLLAAQAMQMAPGTVERAPCGMPSMEHHVHGASGTAGTHATSGDMQDCGYCSFFAHLPVVSGVPVALFVVGRLVQARIAAQFESVRLVAPAGYIHARAPPLS